MPQAAEFNLPPEDGRSLEQEIEAEITDHLALAANAQRVAGAGADEALTVAKNKFGDVAAIKRRLWWIHQGDRVMLRTVTGAVLFILVAGLAFLAYRDSQMQQAFDERMGQLNEQLVELNRTQRELLVKKQSSDVLAITGRCFLGKTDVPAAGAVLMVCLLTGADVIDKNVVRSISTNENGAFDSGPLPPGDYCIIAKLIEREPAPPNVLAPRCWIQSQPCCLYPGARPQAPLALDLRLHAGTVTLGLASPLPTYIKPSDSNQVVKDEDGSTIVPIIGVNWWVQNVDHQNEYWKPGAPEPREWPIRVSNFDWSRGFPAGSPEMSFRLDSGTYSIAAHLCAGKLTLTAPRGNPAQRSTAARESAPNVTIAFDTPEVQRSAESRTLRLFGQGLVGEEWKLKVQLNDKLKVQLNDDERVTLDATIPERFLERLTEVIQKPGWGHFAPRDPLGFSARFPAIEPAEDVLHYSDLFKPQSLKLERREPQANGSR